ncbi:MAG: hypothetical protein KF729_18890 [Sandaracinaceae bacterium]|nr:hypothetical protein [Sandaracinaceae bacterium]
MSSDTSSRWAAGFGALAVLVTFGLLALREGSPFTSLAVVPLFAGLVGAALGRTWGLFAALGGAALLFVASGVGEVPGWAALVAAAGLAVVALPLVRAVRFDAAAASAWMAFAGLTGGAGALAWHERAAPVAAAPRDLEKPVAARGVTLEVDWRGPSYDDARAWEHRRRCRHRGGRW